MQFSEISSIKYDCQVFFLSNTTHNVVRKSKCNYIFLTHFNYYLYFIYSFLCSLTLYIYTLYTYSPYCTESGIKYNLFIRPHLIFLIILLHIDEFGSFVNYLKYIFIYIYTFLKPLYFIPSIFKTSNSFSLCHFVFLKYYFICIISALNKKNTVFFSNCTCFV